MLYVFISLALLILYIAIAVSILKLPKIKRYNEATMKLTALIALKNGVDKDLIRKIVFDADSLAINEDRTFETALNIEK